MKFLLNIALILLPAINSSLMAQNSPVELNYSCETLDQIIRCVSYSENTLNGAEVPKELHRCYTTKRLGNDQEAYFILREKANRPYIYRERLASNLSIEQAKEQFKLILSALKQCKATKNFKEDNMLLPNERKASVIEKDFSGELKIGYQTASNYYIQLEIERYDLEDFY
ncbi:MAG: hypothetical protein JNJ58_06135 [Chitinophagaceae bacterium]|nr:hypothetical protein [Chitinophagaceae bacterium]